jgi:hypothetical protein
MTLIYAPLSGLPILFAWSVPTVALFFYALMMMGGIIAGFLVKITEEDD